MPDKKKVALFVVGSGERWSLRPHYRAVREAGFEVIVEHDALTKTPFDILIVWGEDLAPQMNMHTPRVWGPARGFNLPCGAQIPIQTKDFTPNHLVECISKLVGAAETVPAS